MSRPQSQNEIHQCPMQIGPWPEAGEGQQLSFTGEAKQVYRFAHVRCPSLFTHSPMPNATWTPARSRGGSIAPLHRRSETGLSFRARPVPKFCPRIHQCPMQLGPRPEAGEGQHPPSPEKRNRFIVSRTSGAQVCSRIHQCQTQLGPRPEAGEGQMRCCDKLVVRPIFLSSIVAKFGVFGNFAGQHFFDHGKTETTRLQVAGLFGALLGTIRDRGKFA